MKSEKGKKPKKLSRFRRSDYVYLGCSIAVVLFVALLIVRPERVESKADAFDSRPVSQVDTVFVSTPLRPIAKGEKLSAVQFTRTEWPRARLGLSFVQDIGLYPEAVALNPLPAHLPIPLDAIASSPADAVANVLVDRIPTGFRAITVNVDAESAVEGWARPGNYVDVIVLRLSKNGESGIEAKVISENVRILSAGQSTEPLSGQSAAPRPPATVTLLVSQEDALKIKTAANVGKLTFSLRGTGDESPTLALTMDQKTLLDSAKTVIPKKEAFRGKATGPDGKVYFLGDDSQWVRRPEG